MMVCHNLINYVRDIFRHDPALLLNFRHYCYPWPKGRSNKRWQVGMLSIFYLLCACTGSQPAIQSIALLPQGDNATGAPKILDVEKNSPAEGKLHPGDKIIALDSKEVTQLKEVWSHFLGISQIPQKFTVLNIRGEKKEFPVDIAYDKTLGRPWVRIFENDQAYVLDQITSGLPQDVASFSNKESVIILGSSYWPFHLPYVEVTVILQMQAECKACTFDNIVVRDKTKKSILEPIPTETVAYLVYPPLRVPGQRVAVPTPSITGYQAFSHTSGTINANTYGNNVYGHYSGTTNTTLSPTYDYTAQNAAMWHNVGVALQEQRINNQDQARMAFYSRRVGDLRLGKLEGGAIRTGTVFFAAPPYSTGPYEIELTISGKPIKIAFSMPPGKQPQ